MAPHPDPRNDRLQSVPDGLVTAPSVDQTTTANPCRSEWRTLRGEMHAEVEP
jgi:hypothetical protein